MKTQKTIAASVVASALLAVVSFAGASDDAMNQMKEAIRQADGTRAVDRVRSSRNWDVYRDQWNSIQWNSITNADEVAKDFQEYAVTNGFFLARFDEKKGATTGVFGDVTVVFTNTVPEGRWFNTNRIVRTLASKGVRKGEPFNYNRLYEAFKELNANPDLHAGVRLVGAHDAVDGAERSLDVKLEVAEKLPLHLVAGVDNYGSGPDDGLYDPDKWMARATAQYLDLFDGQAVTATGLTSLDSDYRLYGGAASWYVPFALGRREAAFTLHGGYTDVTSDEVVPDIDVEGDAWFGGAQVSVELVPDMEDSFRFALGLTRRHVMDQLVVKQGQEKEKLNRNPADLLPLSMALMYSSRSFDGWMGRNYATLEFLHNLYTDDNKVRHQRFVAEADYNVFHVQLARLQMLGTSGTGNWMAFGKVDVQWTEDALVSAEQMGIGGALSVRGYRERKFLGDKGVVGTLELRTPVALGLLDGGARDRLQGVVFCDGGVVKLNDTLEGEDGGDNSLLSLGVGFRFGWKENALVKFDWGVPLVHLDANKKDDGDENFGCGHVLVQVQY